MNGRCETCDAWGAERAHKEDYPVGTCRARAPSGQIGESVFLQNADGAVVTIYRGKWPWTAFDDWCFDYLAKPAPVVVETPEIAALAPPPVAS